jgi:hypothetical protein
VTRVDATQHLDKEGALPANSRSVIANTHIIYEFVELARFLGHRSVRAWRKITAIYNRLATDVGHSKPTVARFESCRARHPLANDFSASHGEMALEMER